MKQLLKIKTHHHNMGGALGSAIGIGLLAGLMGTAAITLSQTIEMEDHQT